MINRKQNNRCEDFTLVLHFAIFSRRYSRDPCGYADSDRGGISGACEAVAGRWNTVDKRGRVWYNLYRKTRRIAVRRIGSGGSEHEASG